MKFVLIVSRVLHVCLTSEFQNTSTKQASQDRAAFLFTDKRGRLMEGVGKTWILHLDSLTDE